MNIPIVQLANVKDIGVTLTVIDSPVWRAKLWVNPYEKHLPFMADTDPKYNKYAVSLQNIIIDFIEYLKVYDYNVLRKTDRSWMTDPDDSSRLFIHLEDHNPLYKFVSLKSGSLTGFSYGKPVQLGNLKTYPLLLDFPPIEDTADNLTYKKMSFSSGNISIDNSSGMLDELLDLFGNDLAVFTYNGNKLEIIRQYFIEQYSIGLQQVSFSVKDKRSRLTFKAPDTLYTKDEFPDIEDNLVNKVIQDAYGHCRGVAGTCVNKRQVYTDVENKIFNDWFRFKFARKITKIKEVYVNMSDIWTEVFPGLGIKDITSSDKYQKHNPHPIKIMTKNPVTNKYDIQTDVTAENMDNLPDNNGVIAIYWSQALKDNPGHLERRNGNANKVKMTGTFVDLNTSGEIVKDMMIHYGEIPYEALYFNLENWEKEMYDKTPIGICLDKADDVYSWVEKIQNGSLFGFQLLVYKDLFSARIDNPNRQETFNIHWSEIQNRDQIEPELNGDNYATYAVINYSKDNTEDEYLTIVDNSQRQAVLDVYKYEKEYVNDSFLTNEDDAVKKGKIILENFMQVHPVFRNIELDGLRWEEIELFSTGFIDFSVELPRQMKIIQKYMKQRNFMGKLRVKVIGIKRDIILEKVYIDVIQCDKLVSIPDMQGSIPDETGEKEIDG